MVGQRIFLIGPMGAGKSTVGRRLARRLGLRFVDCDALIEQRTGATVATIFEIEGEAGFRQREHQVLDEVTRWPDVVVATGGGVVVLPENRAVLRARGTVVYLHTSVEEQVRRTAGSTHRPLLQVADPRAQLETLAAAREPLYRELADVVVESDAKHVNATVRDILAHVMTPGDTHGIDHRRAG